MLWSVMAESRPPSQPVTIRVNGQQLSVAGGAVTAGQLRSLAGVPSADIIDLFLELPGLAEDRILDDSDVVEVEDGMSFFSVPRAIMAG